MESKYLKNQRKGHDGQECYNLTIDNYSYEKRRTNNNSIMWYLPLKPLQKTFETLIENTANNDVWGTDITIISLSILVKRPIFSYTAYINSCLYTNPLNSSSSPLKIILNNSHFTAILPINIQNNYGYVPLNINELKKKDSFNSDNEIVYEILN